jgi:hypothetical protein
MAFATKVMAVVYIVHKLSHKHGIIFPAAIRFCFLRRLFSNLALYMMNRFNSIYSIILILLIPVLMGSCRKEKFLDSGGELRFSVDTLMFDTVFVSRGSFTASLKIYNPQNQKINISSIRIEGGSLSQFKINVNGTPGSEVKDIEIAANDSIYVFATVNIDPDPNNNTPFVVNDRLTATLNGRNYSVPFMAFGQNAYYLIDSLIESNQTWLTDKPYVIIHNAAVGEGVTLTIPAGCRVYVHGDSRLLVLGTLKIQGTKQDSVVFQSDRLDRKYYGNEGYPGEWGGIYFSTTSHDNEIDYAILKNVGNSTRLGQSVFSPAAIQVNHDTINDQKFQLVIRNTIIENSIGYGILAFGSTVKAENCLVNTAGAQCFAAFEGGQYVLDNCTFVTYGTNKVSHIDNPVMALLNYRDVNSTSYVAGPLQVVMTNCVVWGSLETEFFAASRGDITKPESLFDVTLNNCLIKNKDGIPEHVKANAGTKVNAEPMFTDYATWNYRPAAGSPLINAGMPNGVTTDLDGKARDGQPDIGCYEN